MWTHLYAFFSGSTTALVCTVEHNANLQLIEFISVQALVEIACANGTSGVDKLVHFRLRLVMSLRKQNFQRINNTPIKERRCHNSGHHQMEEKERRKTVTTH